MDDFYQIRSFFTSSNNLVKFYIINFLKDSKGQGRF